MSKIDHTGYTEDIPENFRLQYGVELLAQRVRETGTEITTWAREVRNNSGQDVLAIPVLRGGIFFFSDLVRSVAASIEIAPVRTVGYDSTTNGVATDSVSIIADSLNVKGRSVLLVDDICDSGRTFAALDILLRKNGATEVRTAVLIKRIFEHKTFDPSWVGFEYRGPEWFVGYGMDDAERWRNLPAVYTIHPHGAQG